MLEHGRVLIEAADEAVRIWAEYRREGAEDVGLRVGPRSLARRAPLRGPGVAQGVARFVEETPGFGSVEAALRATHGLAARARPLDPGDGFRCVWPRLTVEGFLARVAEGLPREFRPPHEEPCEKEYEAMRLAQEASSLAEIDARFRARYPGLVREGFGWRKR